MSPIPSLPLEAGTLDEWAGCCTQVDMAGWMAVLLEQAGVVEVLREKPARVRLAD